tara:strand:- start:7580 stop:10201 length:2622 start_codon:yes stop_codon:yes gene_type:complete
MANNDIVFTEISLRAPGDESYTNILSQFQASSTFGGMSIEEGIFNGGISGFIILNDPNPDSTAGGGLPNIGNLAKSGSMLRLAYNTTITEQNRRYDMPPPNVPTGALEFYVYSVSIVSDISPGIVKLGSSQAVTYRLEFASYESTAINYETIDLFSETEDYVGTFSDFVNKLTSPDEVGIMAPTNSDEETTPDNIVVNTAGVPPEIYPTYNGAWFKRKQSLYPWGKEKTIPSLNTLLTASLNYATPTIDQSDDDDRGTQQTKNLSYVFYQSMPNGQWHLIPIGGTIETDGLNGEKVQSLYKKNYVDGSEDVGYHTYRFTKDETISKRIEVFKLIKDKDLLELEEAGVFGSSFRLIEPNYRGIYSGINVDSDDQDDDKNEEQVHDDSIIGVKNNMYYHDAMSVASHLKQESVSFNYNEFISDGIGSNENPLLGDEILSGRENPAFSSIVDTVYGYFDTSYLYKPFPTRNDDYASSRGSRYMWQPMFDMCDLPLITDEKTGQIGIKEIIKIRNEYEQGRLAYAILSDLKEQWNRYQHSVCCDSSVGGDRFLAMLIGATGGAPNEETGDYDRDLVPFAIPDGLTVANLYRYSFVEVEVWPKALVPEGITLGILGISAEEGSGLDDDSEYVDYLRYKDINPATGESQIHIAGNSGGDGLTLTFGLSAGDAGQEYKINQEQEFFVIPANGGRKGLFTAYNTMELSNNKAFTNAGINIRGYNYPSGFNLMPIGGMTSGQGGESDSNTTYIPPSYMGSIVEMTSINNELLNSFKTNANVLSDTYEGPDGVESSGPNAVVGLLNNIFGTKNLPDTFAGSSGELVYRENGDKVNRQRDDRSDRPDITEDAKPEKRQTVLSKSSNTEVYLFTSENDHDGRCST